MNTYNFSVKQGDTYNGATFTIVVNDEPLDLTGAHFLCQFRKSPAMNAALTWTEEDGISLVTSPYNNKFQFDSQIIDLPPETYFYAVQMTLASGEVKTYVSGKMTVLKDITYV